jgi:hypothetical protein
MGEDRNGSIQAGCTLAFGDQEAQKHTNRGGALFGRRPSTPLTCFQDKLTQVRCLEPARIFSQTLQQVAYMEAVIVKGGIASAALLPHPPTKGSHQGRLHHALFCHSLHHYAGSSGIPEEKVRTTSEITLVRMAKSWAAASIQVPDKLID